MMRPSITYVLPDLQGGVFTYVRNLLDYSKLGTFETFAVLTRSIFGGPFANERIGAEHEIHFCHQLPKENLYSVARRLLRVIPKGPGVVVTNDILELAAFSIYDPDKMLVMLMHGDWDYYYDLATKHANIIDYFVASSKHMAAKLCDLLPERSESVLRLPYGVTIPTHPREHRTSTLRAVFIGRMTGQKRVLDLPKIDRELHGLGVSVEWTIIGSGPDEALLREEWAWNPEVQWTGSIPNEAAKERLLENDILVMPSQSEGFPVTLVEAAAAGVVPVASDLPSGIPEIAIPGCSGFRVPIGDTRQFAAAIASLASNREMLENMSREVRRIAVNDFDIHENVRAYDRLYERYAEERPNRRRCQRLQYGSRLDQPWIPNFAVRAIRSVTRRDL
jgi:glycosyltransferase involved in cell wall biosynthesis